MGIAGASIFPLRTLRTRRESALPTRFTGKVNSIAKSRAEPTFPTRAPPLALQDSLNITSAYCTLTNLYSGVLRWVKVV